MTMDDDFARFRAAYPKRKGSNPLQPARKSFERAVKGGVSPEMIISAALVYATEQRDLKHVGTPYVAQAATWLNQQRWADYASDSGSEGVEPMVWINRDSSLWAGLSNRHFAETGRKPATIPGLNGLGWHFRRSWLETRKDPGEDHSTTGVHQVGGLLMRYSGTTPLDAPQGLFGADRGVRGKSGRGDLFSANAEISEPSKDLVWSER